MLQGKKKKKKRVEIQTSDNYNEIILPLVRTNKGVN